RVLAPNAGEQDRKPGWVAQGGECPGDHVLRRRGGTYLFRVVGNRAREPGATPVAQRVAEGGESGLRRLADPPQRLRRVALAAPRLGRLSEQLNQRGHGRARPVASLADQLAGDVPDESVIVLAQDAAEVFRAAGIEVAQQKQRLPEGRRVLLVQVVVH